MAEIKVSLPADLVLDVMILSDIHDAQDAVESILQDYVRRSRRTEAITGRTPETRGDIEGRRGDTAT